MGTLKRVQLRETSHFSGAGEQHQLAPGIVLEREELQRMPQTQSQVTLQSLHRKVANIQPMSYPFLKLINVNLSEFQGSRYYSLCYGLAC